MEVATKEALTMMAETNMNEKNEDDNKKKARVQTGPCDASNPAKPGKPPNLNELGEPQIQNNVKIPPDVAALPNQNADDGAEVALQGVDSSCTSWAYEDIKL